MIEFEVEEYCYPNGNFGLKNFKEKFYGCEFITGATGCGKSTILRMMNGAIPKLYSGTLKGKVKFCGKEVDCRKIFLVPQNIEESVVCSTVIEEVAFPLIQRNFSINEAKKIAEEVCEEIGIGHLIYKDPLKISTGELQLVEIASAIACGSFLALDEPFAHLSRRNVEKVIKIVKDFHHVVADHRIEFAGEFDRVVNLGLKIEDFEIPYYEYELGEVIYEPLNLREGEIIAITGDNGSGKTTMLKRLAKDMRSKKIDFSIVLQHPAYHLNASTVLAECGNFICDFELESFAEKHPQSLSFGQMMRVAIAKAFKSKILLLDEPTAGQDINFRKKIVTLLRKYKKGAVIATHDEELAKLCDRRIEL
ncbi:MAG: ATP-binding cassette domain-containing protein [Archaeoglobales archaeon]|nr:ATP-binding cassette domain-containing protein [Archaeoglobales archaeon]